MDQEQFARLAEFMAEHVRRFSANLEDLERQDREARERMALAERRMESAERRMESAERRMESAERRMESAERRMESAERQQDRTERTLRRAIRVGIQSLRSVDEQLKLLAEAQRVTEAKFQAFVDSMRQGNGRGSPDQPRN